MHDSTSDDDDDDDEESGNIGTYTSTTAVGNPYMRNQGAYLPNLLKLLNESKSVGMQRVLRWHPKIANALQINWREFDATFHTVHGVLVKYKISRATNQPQCVRPTMNRKLREWCFSMVSEKLITDWVSYVYKSAQFCRDGLHGDLPSTRRVRR